MTVATQDPTLSPADAATFRARCREFLASHTGGGPARNLEDALAFLQAAADAGLGGITYPTEYGGRA